MNLTVQREPSDATTTIGALYVDGVFECLTLEDVVREVFGQAVDLWKIAGQTAIPHGNYDVVIDFSNHFQRPMPHILNVPGFSGIRIHSGNTAADTEGCILLGEKNGTDEILASRAAFDVFFPKLEAALTTNDRVTISILGPDDLWPNA